MPRFINEATRIYRQSLGTIDWGSGSNLAQTPRKLLLHNETLFEPCVENGERILRFAFSG